MKPKFFYHPVYQRIRYAAQQLLLPFIIFQLLRTIFFPTSLDVLILVILGVLHVCILLEWL